MHRHSFYVILFLICFSIVLVFSQVIWFLPCSYVCAHCHVFVCTHVPSDSPEQSLLHLEGWVSPQPAEINVQLSVVLWNEEAGGVCASSPPDSLPNACRGLGCAPAL